MTGSPAGGHPDALLEALEGASLPRRAEGFEALRRILDRGRASVTGSVWAWAGVVCAALVAIGITLATHYMSPQQLLVPALAIVVALAGAAALGVWLERERGWPRSDHDLIVEGAVVHARRIGDERTDRLGRSSIEIAIPDGDREVMAHVQRPNPHDFRAIDPARIPTLYLSGARRVVIFGPHEAIVGAVRPTTMPSMRTQP